MGLTKRELIIGGVSIATLGAVGLLAAGRSEFPFIPATRAELTPGWQRFRSTNYPYEIDYPPGWKPKTQQIQGKLQDLMKGSVAEMFGGEIIDNSQIAVAVSSESINNWVNAKDYAQGLAAHVRRATTSVEVSESKIDVAGNKTYLVEARDISAGISPDLRSYTAVFIAGGRGWQIGYYQSTNVPLDPVAMEKFHKMLSSFWLIK